MIIGLCGPPGAGKDTVGEILVRNHGFRRIAFADALRDYVIKSRCVALGPNGVEMPVEEIVRMAGGWDAAKRNFPTVRHALINVGMAMRQHKGGYWVGRVTSQVMQDPSSNWVVTDVRFEDESRVCDWMWEIVRPGYDRPTTQPSERWEPQSAYLIPNFTTVEALEGAVAQALIPWEDDRG